MHTPTKFRPDPKMGRGSKPCDGRSGLSFLGATGLKKKFKIPPHYVFAYGHCAHTYAFLAFSDENCTTSSKKCQKVAKIDKFIAPGDLDLDRATLTLVPGRQFFQDTPSLPISG